MKVCNNAAHYSKSISHLPVLFTSLWNKIIYHPDKEDWCRCTVKIGGGSTTTDPHSLNVDIKFGKPPLSVTLASWFLKGVGTGIHLAQESSTFQKDWTKTYLGPVSQQNYLQYHIHCWLPSYFLKYYKWFNPFFFDVELHPTVEENFIRI